SLRSAVTGTGEKRMIESGSASPRRKLFALHVPIRASAWQRLNHAFQIKETFGGAVDRGGASHAGPARPGPARTKAQGQAARANPRRAWFRVAGDNLQL